MQGVQAKFLLLLILTTIITIAYSDDCFDYGTDYYGFDMDDGHYVSTANAEACQIECQNTNGCEYWTWDPDYHSACWKKYDKGESRPSGSLISGPKYCGDPPEPNPNEIRLMSYNMFGWNALQDPVKTENMYRIIRAFNPDLLGTQESEREEEIASNIGNDYSVSGGRSQGHSIMYRNSIFELNDFGYVNLGPHDKWGQRSVEYALLTHKSTGKQIDHFNTHFCVCTDTISDCCGQEGQYQSAKEVQAAMELYRRPGSQMILTGDLNVFDGFEYSKAIKYLKGDLDGVNTPFPLEDTFRTANGENSDGTTFPYTGKVDYVFASPGTQVNGASIDRGNYGPASDHWSINAVIEIQN